MKDILFMHYDFNNLPSRPLNKGEGYCYLIFSQGVTKIGMSTNPKSRISNIIKSMPFDEAICMVSESHKNFKSTERSLHKKYFSKRKHGEWFDIDPINIPVTLECGCYEQEDVIAMKVAGFTKDRIDSFTDNVNKKRKKAGMFNLTKMQVLDIAVKKLEEEDGLK